MQVGLMKEWKSIMKERIYSIINSGWDLIIIDEAHRVAGSSGEVARYNWQSVSTGQSLFAAAFATPITERTEPFLLGLVIFDC